MGALLLLCHSKFEILENQLITHISAEGQQGNGDFGNDAGFIILDIGVVAPDINDRAAHSVTPFRKPPLFPGAVVIGEV